MKASEVLRAGLAKLDGGKAWTQGGPARKRNHHFTDANDPKAVKWCSLGAINIKNTHGEFEDAEPYLAAVTAQWVDTWNDAPERTFADVEAAFQKAIALAEKDEQAA